MACKLSQRQPHGVTRLLWCLSCCTVCTAATETLPGLSSATLAALLGPLTAASHLQTEAFVNTHLRMTQRNGKAQQLRLCPRHPLILPGHPKTVPSRCVHLTTSFTQFIYIHAISSSFMFSSSCLCRTVSPGSGLGRSSSQLNFSFPCELCWLFFPVLLTSAGTSALYMACFQPTLS